MNSRAHRYHTLVLALYIYPTTLRIAIFNVYPSTSFRCYIVTLIFLLFCFKYPYFLLNNPSFVHKTQFLGAQNTWSYNYPFIKTPNRLHYRITPNYLTSWTFYLLSTFYGCPSYESNYFTLKGNTLTFDTLGQGNSLSYIFSWNLHKST